MDKNYELFKRAERVIPGGVNSPVRAFRSVGGKPPFIAEAHGSELVDEEGKHYIDYVGSWGPMVLGHDHPEVRAAVGKALENSTSFGAPTRLEVEMAEWITSHLPFVEMVRMVNSGTEAAMSALRLARGFTGRDKIVKCAGCYHGHGDSLLVDAGSGALTFGIPSSPGVPEALAKETIVVPFNKIGALEKAFAENRGKIAAFIVEPLAGNMGVIPPKIGYLEAARALTEREGIVLIFDEVMSGFRVAPGGMIERSGVVPDLVTYGKIIGGGLPVGAYGGRRELMEMVSPSGPVYQAGTLSGNPLAMTAGLTTLKILEREGQALYERLDKFTTKLCSGLIASAGEAGVQFTVNHVGSMFTGFFTGEVVTNLASVKKCDIEAFGRFHGEMLKRGIYLPPSQFESAFLSAAHTEEDVDHTIRAAREALRLF